MANIMKASFSSIIEMDLASFTIQMVVNTLESGKIT